ncbi:hypothetical protein [Microviridae sp.]|nr:hypothetical protein [Microviridae sp.]
MVRPKNNRTDSGWPTRRSPFQSLGHTVGPRSVFEADEPPAFGGGFSSPVRSPLIRTVLEIPFQPKPPRRSTPRSPVAQARATGRSNDRRTRSPFLNATMVTPELTERAMICARRGIRREVLFATKRTGKGAKSPKRYKSKLKC